MGLILPTSDETEMAVLSAMLVREGAAKEVDLPAEAFYYGMNRRAYQAMRDIMARNGGVPDLIELRRALLQHQDTNPTGLTQFLARVGDHLPPKGKGLLVYCQRLRELAYRREVMRLERDAAGWVAQDDSDPDQVEQIRQATLARLRERLWPTEQEWQGAAGLDELRDFWLHYDDRNMVTGWEELDEVVGDLYPGMVLTVIARPGVGKSYLGSNLIARWLAEHQWGMLWASLEMPRTLTMERLVRQRLGVPRWELRQMLLSGGLPTWVAEELDQRLALISRPGTSARRLGQVAEQHAMRSGQPVRAVVVDYLQYMDRGRGGERPYERVTRLCQELKELAKERDALVVLLSQVKRPGEGKGDSQYRRPTMEDARDSGAVEENADVLLGLWRDRDDDELINLEAIKVREGGRPGRPVALRMDWQTGRLAGAGDGPAANEDPRQYGTEVRDGTA